MYEIWLASNILYEMAAAVWPLLLSAAGVWVALVLWAWRRPGSRWRASLPPALGLGALVAVAAVPLVPLWTRSSIGEMGYWVDWANLLAIAAGLGGVAAAFVWPLLAGAKGATGSGSAVLPRTPHADAAR